MIHRTAASWQRIDAKIETKSIDHARTAEISPLNPWQQALQQSITDPRVLLDTLEIDHSQLNLSGALEASQSFALRVPMPFVQRMEKGNIDDPLLRQVLPIDAENRVSVHYSHDPVGEQQNPTAGIIHKYHGRALFIVNGHCAVNCRYCFRRHFPYGDNRLNRSQWEESLSTIASDPTITEIIYSGGDPLASSDKQLLWLTEQIAAIPHIQRLRIHTRLPVVIPSRITPESLTWMTKHRLSTVMVLHINHANELNDPELLKAIQTLKQAGITILNQAVLLKGVNDSEAALVALSEALFEAGVLPYYLHLLDKVQGAAHFEVNTTQAKRLHQQITDRLPGYLVPKLVTEVAGQAAKTPV